MLPGLSACVSHSWHECQNKQTPRELRLPRQQHGVLASLEVNMLLKEVTVSESPAKSRAENGEIAVDAVKILSGPVRPGVGVSELVRPLHHVSRSRHESAPSMRSMGSMGAVPLEAMNLVDDAHS
ncbi:hypothetical protein E4U43_000211 [Claviceps pusilla]|uniref:Uncharacterized protein n=1 Tax=Claviceps pusilla TaxID=123648 RepID=A0A9P7T089_9HYPO|nr:hypothetical protein E4U43_000211 [Claviceps pusilla]